MTEQVAQQDELNADSFSGVSQEDLNALDAQLAADEAELPDDLKATGTQKPETDEEPEPDSPAQPKAAETPKQPVKQNAQQKPDENKDGQPKTEEKPLSKYEEAKKKAQEREAKAWQKIEAEKKALSDREAALKVREMQFGQKANQQPAPEQPDIMNDPDALDEAAKQFEAKGNFDMADAARERAAELRRNPAARQPQQQQAPVANRSYFDLKDNEPTLSGQLKGEVTRQQNELYGQARKEMPEVLERGSELNQKFLEQLQQNPEALHFPRGPYMLARLVHLESSASRLAGLQQELAASKTEKETLQKRIKELELLTAPGGGDLTDPALSERTFDQLSTDEMEAQLDQMVRRSG